MDVAKMNQMLTDMITKSMGESDSKEGELIRSGWVYRDFPKMDAPLFDHIMSHMGETNVHLITIAIHREGENGDIKFKRGQILISPEGITNLATASNAWAAKQKDKS